MLSAFAWLEVLLLPWAARGDEQRMQSGENKMTHQTWCGA
jgi:hypothetical protein